MHSKSREKRLSRYDVRLIARTGDSRVLFVSDNGLLKLPGGKAMAVEMPDLAIAREVEEEALRADMVNIRFRDFKPFLSKPLEGHERIYFTWKQQDESKMLVERFLEPQWLRSQETASIGEGGEIPLLIPIEDVIREVERIQRLGYVSVNSDGSYGVINAPGDYHGDHALHVVLWFHKLQTQ